MNTAMRRWLAPLAAALCLLAPHRSALAAPADAGAKSSPAYSMGLLLPHDADPKQPALTAWIDAAEEEGIPLATVSANDFLREVGGKNAQHFAALILPDSVHRAAPDALVTALDAYVKNGGKLMVVYDAATLTFPNKAFAPGKSRLSALVGVDYALYDELKDKTTAVNELITSGQFMHALRVPPGKYTYPMTKADGPAPPQAHGQKQVRLLGYAEEAIRYPHFTTRGPYAGTPLMQGADGSILAGQRNHGAGKVLYVNVPLGYLKTRTDGLLLHGFLQYFSREMLQLPTLDNVPNGVGGLVMNWHIDSNASLPALRKIKATRIFEQGPYSVHLTAGPDTKAFNDSLGLNVPGNPETQEWLRFFAQRGDRVASHGGWIHDYFGFNLSDNNRKDFEPFLVRNKEAIEAVTKQPMTEYSAPLGNQPLWVTEWLRAHKMNAYYFTGNSGMGATRTYREDKRSFSDMWAFPVMIMGGNASFEEMIKAGVRETDVSRWMRELSDYAAQTGSIRLVYFHPPGLLFFPNAIDQWLDKTAELKKQGKFLWYTMTEVGQYQNERMQVTWSIRAEPAGEITISATHPRSLASQAWRLPTGRFGRPSVAKGNAEVSNTGAYWLVRAKGDAELIFRARVTDR